MSIWLFGHHRTYYHTRMANSALKCQIIILITARSLCSYNNILINFGQLYSNSCYTTFNIATLGMCIACEFHQLWAVKPCIYHIFREAPHKMTYFMLNWPCRCIITSLRDMKLNLKKII